MIAGRSGAYASAYCVLARGPSTVGRYSSLWVEHTRQIFTGLCSVRFAKFIANNIAQDQRRQNQNAQLHDGTQNVSEIDQTRSFTPSTNPNSPSDVAHHATTVPAALRKTRLSIRLVCIVIVGAP